MDDSDSARDEGRSDGGEAEGSLEGVQDAAEQRRRERTDRVEGTLADVRADLGEQSYPVSSEDLAATYADQSIDLPNETESLGSVFRRLEDTFEDEEAAYEAVAAELSVDEAAGVREGEASRAPATWSEERAETQHEFREDPIPDEVHESSVERSRERAREAQADSDDEA